MNEQAQRDIWDTLREKVQAQTWPQASLYVVATPIGNLGDLSLRAWQTLMRCDIIAAEDTRASRQLLQAWGVDTPLMAAHRHNEAAAAQAIVARLQQGERVALVSDAGAPAVSDPGGRIVRAVRAAGFQVVPLPGPSAVITALMASGVTSDENPAYAFAGFIPSKATARRKWLEQWQQYPMPVVFFESPHRLLDSLKDIAAACEPDRCITIARELSKRFEQVHTLPLAQVHDWVTEDSHRQQGEFVLILHAPEQAEDTQQIDPDIQRWMKALLEHLSLRDAAKLVSKVTGVSRDMLYAWGLANK